MAAFQFTPARGGRLAVRSVKLPIRGFNSRPRVAGDAKNASRGGGRVVRFNSRPRVAGDSSGYRYDLDLSGFNSRPRVAGDNCRI